MASSKTQGMICDGLAATEAIDTSGEILDVEGCDISDYVNGLAEVNWEHKGGGENKDDSASDLVGRIIYAKKLFTLSDCETERQRKFFRAVDLPCVYIVYRLYDAAGHQGAKDLAAQIRDHVANGEKVLVRLSIEGSTIKKVGNTLKNSVARRVAATVKPANRSCDTGLLLDPGAPSGFEVMPEGSADAEEALRDINVAVGADRDENSILTRKFEDPRYMKLPGAWEGEPQSLQKKEDLLEALASIKHLRKAIEAGGYNAAPGTLTGGSALAREDESLGRRAKANQLKAAYRDWDKAEDLGAYLKKKLPEMSDSFISKFVELANDYSARKTLLKAEPLQKRAKPEPEPDEHAESGDTSFDPAALEAQTQEPEKKLATKWLWPKALKDKHKKVRGSQPIPRKLEQSYFDESTGTMHTHLGSFPLNIPKDPYYEKILRGPEVQPHHDEAMRHWFNVHNLLKAGQLPGAVAMHAALFSAMSPNTAVPRQEFAYSHLMDLMHGGMNPAKPGGVQTHHGKEFKERVAGVPPTLPEHGREFWQGEGAKGITSQAGDLIRDFAPGQKFDTVASYWKLHPQLADLVRQHRDDGLAMANILGDQKLEAGRFNARAQTRENKTQERQHRFYESTGRSEVPGFATKTIRYLLGMLGAGNIAVPDRHFVRHAFGLPQDEEVKNTVRQELGRDPRTNSTHEEKIASPAGHLTTLLQRHPKSHALMQQIERYYMANHPAVRYVQERFFGGQQDPQSIFPGFWAHWLSIAPHERSLGMNNDASNGGTDHRVYWDSVNQILRHHNLPTTEIKKDEADAKTLPSSYYQDTPLPVRTAAAHRAMVKAFGDEPAMWFYMKHLLPLLLAHHSRRQEAPKPKTVEEALRKLESTTLDLGLELVALRKKEQKQDAAHGNLFRGREVVPGKLTTKDGKQYELVHAGPEGYLARHPEKPGRFMNFQRKHQNVNYRVDAEPQFADTQAKVDARKHGLQSHNTAPEQQQLIHGLDLNAKEAPDPQHFDPGNAAYTGKARWLKGPAGLMYVKDETGHGAGAVANDPDNAHDPDMHAPETTFHNLGRDFFGLGPYLATTAAFRDPRSKGGDVSEAVQVIPGAEHHDERNFAQHHTLGQLLQGGELDKMMVMDNVLANTDRRPANMLFRRDAGNNERRLKLIDHGHAFRYDSPFWDSKYLNQAMPAYLSLADGGAEDEPMAPAALKWLKGLDESGLDAQMKALHVPDRYIVEATRRLRMIRDAALKNPGLTRNQLWATPFVGAKE